MSDALDTTGLAAGGVHLDDEPMAPEGPPERAGGRSGRVRTLLFAAVFLVAIDVGYGVLAWSASSQRTVATELNELGRELAAADDPTILIVGNRTVAAAVDPDQLEGAIVADRPWTVREAIVGSSLVGVWDAAFDQHFVRTGGVPEVLVVGFAFDQLEDQNGTDWSEVGRHYTSWGSLTDRMRSAPDANAAVAVAGARVSSLVGYRQWFIDLAATAVPGYRSLPRSEPRPRGEEATYEILARFVSEASEAGSEVVVVALPTLQPFELPPAVSASVRLSGGRFVDLRLDDELEAADWLGPGQLNSGAKALLNGRLSQSLQRTIDS